MENKTQLICTSGTKESLLEMVKKYYFSENIVILDNNEVWNTKLNKRLGIMVENKNRFRFEI